jgi:precorrin-6B methylase 2
MNKQPTDAMREVSTLIDMAYDITEGAEDLMRYHKEHGTMSALVLTQYDLKCAHGSAELLKPAIENKIVIEIGAGVGFLAMEMARYAKQVYAIEVDPAWSWIFTHSIYRHKPPNLTWIFGKAESMIGILHGDIAVIFTRSGEDTLYTIAEQLADEVIMPLHNDKEK